MTVRETTSEMICKSAIIADATSGREQLWKKFTENTCVINIHVCICKKIDRYVKDRWIYMNTCYRYIWYEKQGKVFFVIEYLYNVSVNSPWIYINTNSTLLASSSSSKNTKKAATADMICNSAITPDATSGKEQLWKNFI